LTPDYWGGIAGHGSVMDVRKKAAVKQDAKQGKSARARLPFNYSGSLRHLRISQFRKGSMAILLWICLAQLFELGLD
jgi:hypothetical protein